MIMNVFRFVAGSAGLVGVVLTSFAAEVKSADNAKPARKADTLFADKVVAKGKGFEIKQSEVEDAFIALRSNLAAQGQNIPEDQRPTVEAKLADRLVVSKILLQKANDEDRKKAKATSEQTVEEARKRFPTEDLFEQQLKARGLSVDNFRSRLLEQSTAEEVLNREVRAKISVSDEQLKKFYDENPAQFEQPESVRASHILLSTKDQTTQKPIAPEAKKSRETEIRKLKTRADAGEDFGKLAREFSEDPGSKDKGGEYTFPRGQMVKPFETAAFSLKTNQVSDVVETEFGYHLIKLHERIPAKKVELATVKTNLSGFLVQQEVEKQLPAYFEQLKKEFKVEMPGETNATPEKGQDTLPPKKSAP